MSPDLIRHLVIQCFARIKPGALWEVRATVGPSMSGLGFNTPISEQINRLNESLKSRDERRQQQKRQRQLQADSEEGAWEGGEPRQADAVKKPKSGARATGGITLGPANGRTSVRLPPPKVYNCKICNAVFHSEVLYQQHLNGPVHRKAVEKIEALKKNDPKARHCAAAEAALQAACWQSQGEHTSRFRSMKPVPASAPKNQHGVRKGEMAPQSIVQGGPSHEEIVARLRSESEPLSINGWVPPAVATPSTLDAFEAESSANQGQISHDSPPDQLQSISDDSNVGKQEDSKSSESPDSGISSINEDDDKDGNLLGLGGYDTDADPGDSD